MFVFVLDIKNDFNKNHWIMSVCPSIYFALFLSSYHMIIMIFCTLCHFTDQEDDVESGEEKQALVHCDYPIKGYYTETCIM